MLWACIIILAGILLLVYGANWFVTSASNIALYLGVSPFLIGVLVVGFATSAPEIMISIISALQGKADIAVGNALGSNIANTGLVLGISALLMPIAFKPNQIRQEYLLFMLVSMIGFWLLSDAELQRYDGIILLTLLILTTIRIICINTPENQTSSESKSAHTTIAILLGSLILLLFGAHILIEGAVTIAKYYGISDLVIGLTIIAIGTSLPELAASIIGIIRKQPDIAIGNIIGSNIFNMLAVIGIPAIIAPSSLNLAVINRDIPALFALCLLFGIFILCSKKGRLGRVAGAILFAGFVAYQYLLYIHSI